jgi:uncharacterized protein YcfJ
MSIRLSTLGLAALCGAAATSGAWAAEYGTVISSTPVMSSAPVQQRECIDEAAPAPRRSSNGAGAAVGALFGAALGNAMGGGSGRALSTGIGMIAGAALGNHAEAQEAAGRDAGTVQRCRDVTRTEQRVVAYDVVYEYQGVQRRVRMAQPPGERILLDVQVVPAGAAVLSGAEPYAAPATAARPPVEAPSRAYRSPGDNRIDDEAEFGRRQVYDDRPLPPAPPVAREAANPVPYLIVGGLTALAIAHAVKSDRPHHPYRHPHRWPRR